MQSTEGPGGPVSPLLVDGKGPATPAGKRCSAAEPAMAARGQDFVHRRSAARRRDRMMAWHVWPAKPGQKGPQQGFEGGDEVVDAGGAV